MTHTAGTRSFAVLCLFFCSLLKRFVTGLRRIVALLALTATAFASTNALAANGASFVSQVAVPTSMVAGQTYQVSITLTNTGTSTWVAAGSTPYGLGSQSPGDNTNFTISRVNVGSDVAPGAQHTFTFNVTPTKAGSYTFQWRMVQEYVEWFGDSTSPVTVNVTAPTPTATLTSPSNNTTTAAPSGGNTGVYVSGSATAGGNSSIAALELLDNGSVISSGGATTSFASTVNLAPGSHALSLRATNAAGGVGLSQTVNVNVLTATQGLNASFVSQSVPSSMRAGQPYTITVKMLNTGTTTWTPSGSTPFRLGTQNPEGNHNWNVTGRAYLSGSVATGQTATFSIPITAPSTTGTYNMQWKMVQEFVTWFGDATTNQAVTVAAGAGPSSTLSATPTNTWVSGTQNATITFTASSTASAGTTIQKLELLQGTDNTDYSNAAGTAITQSSGTTTWNWSPTASVPAGVYLFKLRSTDSTGVATDSKTIIVNVTNSALLGATSGVRTNAAGTPELFGWVCQPGNATALNYKLYLDGPSLNSGATILTSGTANIATESDNASVQSTCSTPGAAHHFVIDLSTYTTQYTGRSLYIWAESPDHSQSVTLPCPDNSCTMPGIQAVAMTTPQTGDKLSSANPAFLRMQLFSYSGTYDEIGFFVNGQWIAAQYDGSSGAYSASMSGLSASSTPYTVYAKVRQGNMTMLSMQNQFTVVAGAATTLSSPTNGASLTVGSPQALAATVSVTAKSVKFFANGTQIGTGANSNGTWSASWTPSSAGSFAITAVAYDGAGAQIAQSATANVSVANGNASSATPLPVNVTPPHLGNLDAGTLPGQLDVGNDGAATYSIDIAVPPGTAGMQPKLSLNYSSNGPNGMVGLGWSLGGLSTIHRCAKTLAQDGVVGRIAFDNSDRLCLDGMRLFRSDGTNPGTDPTAQDTAYWASNAQYRTEIEGFARITRQGTGGFKVELKDGRIQYYGLDSTSAIAAQGRSDGQPLLWALARTEDRSGNYMTVEYTADSGTGEYLPKQVRYGGNTNANQTADLAVRFSYESRTDAQIQYMGGSRNDLRNRLTNVQTFTGTSTDGSGGTRVRNYILHYTTSNNSGRSLVDYVQACAATDSECLPKTMMTWGSNAVKLTQTGAWTEYVNGDNDTFPLTVVSGDFLGNGTTVALYPGYTTVQGAAGLHPFNGMLSGRLYSGSVNLANVNGYRYTAVLAGDLDGDGRDDLVFVDPSSRNWVYCLSLPPNGFTLQFASCQAGPQLPAARYYATNAGDIPNLVSLRNNGKAQLIAFDSNNNMTACSYLNSAISCSTSPVNLPPGNPVFDFVPVDLSKQGMTDFYSSWLDEVHGTSGVTECNFYGEVLKCKNIAPYPGNGPTLAPADVNGDGLTDLLLNTTSGVCLSKETDVDCSTIAPSSGYGSTFSFFFEGFGNLIGDGVNYFVAASTTDPHGAGLCHVVDSKTVCSPIDTSGVPAGTWTIQGERSNSAVYSDASGLPTAKNCSLPYYQTNRYQQDCLSFSLVAPANQDKLIAVVNGVSQREEVDYARGDDGTVYSRFATVNGSVQRAFYPQLSNNPGVLVKQLRRSNGQGSWLSSNYQYAGAMRDALGRGSLGFTKVTVTDPNGITTDTTFAQTFPFAGMATHVSRTRSTCTLEDTVNSLEQQPFNLAGGGQNFFVDIQQSSVARHDLDCSDLGTVTTVNQYTDGWGNLNTQTITSTGNNETFVTKTVSVFNTGSGSNYLSGLPTSIAVTKTNSKNESLTRTVTYTYNATTGLRDTETVEPSNSSYKLVTTYDRSLNSFGLVNKQTQSWTDPACADGGWPSSLNGACTATKSRTLSNVTYDPKGRFPVNVKNALSQTETRSYDTGSGVMTQRVDANNLPTNWTLNGFGRVTVERGPDNNETRSYVKACAGDCPNGATVAQVTEHFNGASRITTPQVTYLDSAGHNVRILGWGFDGTQIVIDQRYDALGRLFETDFPRFDSATAYLETRHGYDDLNRRISVTSVDEGGTQRTATTEYHGFKVVQTNLKSQVKTEWRDVIAELRQVDDSNSPIGTTKFEYDPFGNLAKTTDPAQNVITVTYDQLGRKTDLRDPDLGWIHYDVDPLGQVWAQTSPIQRTNGNKTYMAYDLLGRMTGRYEPDLESHWTYDTAATGVGQLAEAYTKTGSTKDYSRTQTYDAAGRPKLTTTMLSDAAYTSQVDYDAWGRVVTNTYQRGTDTAKIFGSRYNGFGYLARIERGSLVLWQVTAEDAAKRPTTLALGNGLTQTRAFFPQTGRLRSATLATAANVGRLQEGYTYDALGNVMERTQYWDAGGFIEDFTYDALNRLQTSQVQGQSAQTFNYDATGNITGKTGTGTYTYPTPGASAVRPHAVQTVSSMSGTFQYDGDGNMLSGAGRTATWNSFDMPKQLTKGSASASFVYGPEHQRVRQDRSDGSSVVYAGAQEVESMNKVVTAVKTYWPNGVGVEIDRGTSATEMSWMHSDRIGSIVALTDESGAIREKLEYDAWGKRRSTSDNTSTPDSIDGKTDNRGFTGHEMLDQLDLVHMNGRVYDPAIARFMSSDPLITKYADGQSWNRYSYVWNNPTKFVDPSGFSACEGMPNCFETIGERLKFPSSAGGFTLDNALKGTTATAREAATAAAATARFVGAAAYRASIVLTMAITPGNMFQKNDEDAIVAAINAAAASSGADQGKDGDKAGARDTNSAAGANGSPGDPDDEDEKKGKSPNQLNKDIRQGKAPKDVERVDVGKVKGEQTHVHFKDDSALNMDGTWKHGESTLSRATQKWLVENGWKLPK